MHLILCVLMATIGFGTATAHCQALQAGATAITFQSSTYSDFGQLLASEPGIDADRIAILGFSFGGDVAHLTAFEGLRSALSPGPSRFAAHVAFYPSGNLGAIAERGAYTGSPVLMLLGEKDDNLPL